MNVLTTYEQTIATRREEIEIPDMADAIWHRVAAGLDVEMPVVEKPLYKKPAVWIGAGILAIIIVLYFLSINKTNTPQQPLPQRNEPAIQPDTVLMQDVKPPPKPPPPAPTKNTKPVIQKHRADTTAHNLFIIEDSLVKKPPAVKAPPAIKIPAIDIKQRPKYGVEVSDSDYRFKVKPQ